MSEPAPEPISVPAGDPAIAAEVARRRTFAIISHPDAGKTTLTEKLLLYSGMIHTAGMVRGRKGGKRATSDWMAMEQERGISITASAMQFAYKGVLINVLDTPGHQDFSEDTYRTLTAADSAIMVIDGAKGVEAQTRKLFEVCRLRGIPVLTFVNKMDQPGKEPLELMAEVEDVLKIHSSAVTWPVGFGKEFRGVVDRRAGVVRFFTRSEKGGAGRAEERVVPLAAALAELGEADAARLSEELDLLEAAGNPFCREDFLAGRVTPVFFGSALVNFGVELFFDTFAELAPCPSARPVDLTAGGEERLDPVATPFSGYVFKVQANMNPKHRDVLAFLRVCTGRFERDLVVQHHRLGREVRLSRSHSMLAGDRATVDSAFPGDIVGVINPGVFAIGDTVSMGGGFDFKPLPHFQPELFARIRPTDVGKRKSFDKGIEQLAAEGTVQILKRVEDGDTLYAAVGRLQFEVLQYRLRDEYGVETELTAVKFECSAWLEGDPGSFQKPYGAQLVRDRKGRVMCLFQSPWDKKTAIERNPGHKLLDLA